MIVEHNPRVMLAADWIIDLGPDAGDAGGSIVATGTPEDVAKSAGFTAQVLASELAKASDSCTGNLVKRRVLPLNSPRKWNKGKPNKG